MRKNLQKVLTPTIVAAPVLPGQSPLLLKTEEYEQVVSHYRKSVAGLDMAEYVLKHSDADVKKAVRFVLDAAQRVVLQKQDKRKRGRR